MPSCHHLTKLQDMAITIRIVCYDSDKELGIEKNGKQHILEHGSGCCRAHNSSPEGGSLYSHQYFHLYFHLVCVFLDVQPAVHARQ